MLKAHDIEHFQKKAALLKEKLFRHLDRTREAMHNFFGRKPKFIIFISVSNMEERARVFCGVGNTAESAWLNALNPCKKFLKQNPGYAAWMKADLVNEIEKLAYEQFIEYSTKTRRNYLRQGIAFDANFNLAFLEQEINANVLINKGENGSQDTLHLNNINHYMKTYRALKYPLTFDRLKEVYLFTTISYFYDTECHELLSGPLQNGRRRIDRIDKELIYGLIDQSSDYLKKQVEPTGKFVYGYFPCFHKPIQWYNMLRHASTVYSMVEAYELTRKDDLAASIARAVEYLVKDGITFIESGGTDAAAYVVDTDNEIKLGANAAAILALTKYTTVFNTDRYIDVMVALANGIAAMQDPESGSFVHVLHYPRLTVKEKFRIVYYDGEAAFALMRLYAVDKNAKWLNVVEKAFAYFIRENYWKHHDHWLSYCTNELTRYKPLRKYFEFGLNNVKDKLNFILNRETTYPTFLELLMASYKMVEKIRAVGMEDLLHDFNLGKLQEAIEHRVRHQLNGFFFPEVAMYFKSPRAILGAFYIRHHAFRCRIDDIEHNISGYYNYYNTFLATAEADGGRLAERSIG
ncbi:six-hairpin glycosidase-like family protein [Paenibacillus sp. 32O-W]|nr:six-hairpin glycosidase-like family protein [Paenibacillus sp. 32O-W]